jgi:dockerin type I repeat protein
MAPRRAPRKLITQRRPLALEALEDRALCAAVPYHTLLPTGGIYGATLDGDGTIEVIGTPRQGMGTINPSPLNLSSGVVFDGGVDPASTLVKWTIAPGGSIISTTEIGALPFYSKGISGISPDGNWIASNLPPTVPGQLGAPIVLHLGDLSYILVGLPADRTSDSALVRGVSNNGSVIYLLDDKYYAWDRASGLLPLRSLYELEGNTTPDAQQFTLKAISADGQTIVGTSGGGPLPLRATVWRNGETQALPSGNYPASGALSVSANGRVIGGYLQDGDKNFPAVWVDGVLQQIALPAGSNLASNRMILGVVGGIGGNPSGWAALGWDLGSLWITRSDGVVHEFYTNDVDNWGLSGIGGMPVNLFADDNSIYLVTFQSLSVGCAGWSCFTSPSQGHVVSIPLAQSFDAIARYDVSDDGLISPLDALILINALNSDPNTPLSSRPELRQAFLKIDVTGDGELTSADALAVINYLNGVLQDTTPNNLVPAAEGEAAASGVEAVDEYFLTLSPPTRKNDRLRQN